MIKKVTNRKAWSDSDVSELMTVYNQFLTYQESGEKYQKAIEILEYQLTKTTEALTAVLAILLERGLITETEMENF